MAKQATSASHRDALPASLSPALLTIGQLANVCDVSVRTIRFYEEVDLIAPVLRKPNGYRQFNGLAQKRVQAIQALQGLGYSIDDIKTVLGSWSSQVDLSKQAKVQATRDSLDQQRSLVDQKIVDLQSIQKDINNRLATLETYCNPCLDKHPEKPCVTTCTHREAHLS